MLDRDGGIARHLDAMPGGRVRLASELASLQRAHLADDALGFEAGWEAVR